MKYVSLPRSLLTISSQISVVISLNVLYVSSVPFVWALARETAYSSCKKMSSPYWTRNIWSSEIVLWRIKLLIIIAQLNCLPREWRSEQNVGRLLENYPVNYLCTDDSCWMKEHTRWSPVVFSTRIPEPIFSGHKWSAPGCIACRSCVPVQDLRKQRLKCY